jgi:hypothetical protein
VEEHKRNNTQLESEVKKMNVELQEYRAVTLTARVLPSVGGIRKPLDIRLRQRQPPTGGARKLYSELTSRNFEKDTNSLSDRKPMNRQRQLKMF